MPEIAKAMSALAVKKLKHPGTTNNPIIKAVGGVAGLHIQVTNTGAKSWLLRTTINGKRRDMGLGPYPEVSLADARQNAADARPRHG
jgi:Arm DNA-binding domain